uniref:Uncharacterized protein n=1 Tax=Ciona savignyi TaxID=51511 RepID=H2YGM2_CIOSA
MSHGTIVMATPVTHEYQRGFSGKKMQFSRSYHSNQYHGHEVKSFLFLSDSYLY